MRNFPPNRLPDLCRASTCGSTALPLRAVVDVAVSLLWPLLVAPLIAPGPVSKKVQEQQDAPAQSEDRMIGEERDVRAAHKAENGRGVHRENDQLHEHMAIAYDIASRVAVPLKNHKRKPRPGEAQGMRQICPTGTGRPLSDATLRRRTQLTGGSQNVTAHP